MSILATAIGSFAAAGVELVEAGVIVIVAGAHRRRRPAVLGALLGLATTVGLALLLGPLVGAYLPLESLRLVAGIGVLILGLIWLLRAVFAPQLADRELQKETMEARQTAAKGEWAVGFVSFKAVFIESAEAVALVFAIGAPQHELPAAIIGAIAAALMVLALMPLLSKQADRIAPHILQRVAGAVLTILGIFWILESLR